MIDNNKTFRKFAHFENKVPMKRLTEILTRFLRAAPAPYGLAAREAHKTKTNQVLTLKSAEMNNLKLNKLNQISEEMKNAVKGGEAPCCSCGCCYANSGGSSVAANGNENKKYGYHSVTGTDCDTPYDEQWHIVCPEAN